MKAITGQYECVYTSPIGLDYFTARIDKLVLQPNGRFVLTVQKQSRAVNAAQTFLKGEQVTAATPETRLEGNYVQQGRIVHMTFDNGGLEEAQLATNEEGIQIGPNFFTKVSDSTFLPPTHRVKQDMEDIAKGLKIASTLGGIAVKAAQTIQGAIQTGQGQQADASHTNQAAQPGPASTASGTGTHTPDPQPAPTGPSQPAQPPRQSWGRQTVPPPSAQPAQSTHPPIQPPGYSEKLFCDQCGARVRPGKRFCNNCGAQLF